MHTPAAILAHFKETDISDRPACLTYNKSLAEKKGLIAKFRDVEL